MHTLFYEDPFVESLPGDRRREQNKPQLPWEMSKEASAECWGTGVGWNMALLEPKGYIKVEREWEKGWGPFPSILGQPETMDWGGGANDEPHQQGQALRMESLPLHGL